MQTVRVLITAAAAMAMATIGGDICLLAQEATPPASKPNDNPDLPKAPELPGLPEIEVDVPSLAQRLVAKDPGEVLAAYAELRKLPKNARRVTIVKLSADDNANLRADVWRAFAKWVREEDVPLLLDALGSKLPDVRAAAAGLLVRYPDLNNLRWLASHLADPQLRYQVQSLLLEAGPAAEQPVLAYVAEADPLTREAAWETLAHIGGSQSLRLLRQQARQPQFAQDEVLARVIQAIDKRKPGFDKPSSQP